MVKISSNKIDRVGAQAKSDRMVADKKNSGHCRVIAICNQKGGCGKTTSVINLASSLALLKKRVLVIDLDAQGNSTSGLGIDSSLIEVGICDYMLQPKNMGVGDVIVATLYDNLHIAPATADLSHFDITVASEMGRENRIKKFIAALPENYYDFVLIDTPPSLGLLLINALNASSEVFIAMQAHPFSYDGLGKLKETIIMVKEELNPGVDITGIIVTMFDSRTRVSRDIVNELKLDEKLGKLVFNSVIRTNVKIAESNKKRVPVLAYDKACTGAEDYSSLAREVLKRGLLSLNKKSGKEIVVNE